MHVVTDTTALVEDGVVTPEVAAEIEKRGRDAMVSLAINAVLSFGILAATLGLIFWLADAALVAVVGVLFLGRRALCVGTAVQRCIACSETLRR